MPEKQLTVTPTVKLSIAGKAKKKKKKSKKSKSDVRCVQRGRLCMLLYLDSPQSCPLISCCCLWTWYCPVCRYIYYEITQDIQRLNDHTIVHIPVITVTAHTRYMRTVCEFWPRFELRRTVWTELWSGEASVFELLFILLQAKLMQEKLQTFIDKKRNELLLMKRMMANK